MDSAPTLTPRQCTELWSLFPDARTFSVSIVRLRSCGLEAFAREQVSHKRPKTSISYTAALNNGMLGVLYMFVGELDKCTFFSELDECTRFGIVYLSNERHLVSDETEMKRWKIFHIEHLLVVQCQMTGHRVCKNTRRVRERESK